MKPSELFKEMLDKRPSEIWGEMDKLFISRKDVVDELKVLRAEIYKRVIFKHTSEWQKQDKMFAKFKKLLEGRK